jgi:hypothetical protein
MKIKTANLKPGQRIQGLLGGGFTVQAVFPAPLNPGFWFVIMVDEGVEPDAYTTFQTDLSHGNDTYFVSQDH